MNLCFNCFYPVDPLAEACPVCGAPTFTLGPMGRRPNVRRIGGCIPEDPSRPQARSVPVAVDARDLPARVDLRAHCSEVEDQGQLMSCSANATVGAYEYQLRAQGQPALELSRLFVYFNGLRLGRRLNKDDGIRISEGMATLASLGVPEEHLWPYATEKWATEPPEDVYKWAWANRPKEFARIKGGDAIRAALARNRPVVLALTLSLECFNEAAKSGVLRAPAANEKLYTPHAMVVVGYDLGAGEYVLRNSWGKAWGDKGYCRVSFETVERCGEAQEYWVVGDVEQLGQAPRDLPGAAAAPPAPPPSSVVGLAAKLREDIRASLTKDIENAAKDIKERMKPKP